VTIGVEHHAVQQEEVHLVVHREESHGA
jgi:hypothetical protein